MNKFLTAAEKLHSAIVAKHWNDGALIGPDPGVRFNYRIWRFLKSYLRRFEWHDNYYYLQAQSYWILANWAFFDRTGDESYRKIARRCAETILTHQRPDGAWNYPHPEWKGRIATVEGIWASIGLLEAYNRSSDDKFLQGALKWYKFMVDKIGFQRMGDELSINYFANRGDGRVPNNSTTMLSFLAELTHATGNKDYLEHSTGLVTFIGNVQMASGELPYAVAGPINTEFNRPHFQCYQYNAFEALSLMKYYEITLDANIVPVIKKMMDYLSSGIAEDGHACYDCGNKYRAVTYHAAALAAAFTRAEQLGFEGYRQTAERAYEYVLRLQNEDGSFYHSKGDYRIISDNRSYPRYLSMILFHLLFPGFQNVITSQQKNIHHSFEKEQAAS